MECPSCGFQNLPGLQSCARCTSSLEFEGVDVNPYRSSDHWKRMRRIRLALARSSFLARILGIPYILMSWVRMDCTLSIQRMTATIASIVPGFGLILLGQRRKGLWILGIYALLLLALVLFSYYDVVLISAAVLGLHTYAVVLCLFHKCEYIPRFIAFCCGMLVFGTLYSFIYPAAFYALGGIGQLQTIVNVTPNHYFEDRDILLLEGRWIASGAYHAGDIVSYNMEGASGQGWYIPGGVSIDRILAVPGDHVTCKKGRMLINNRPLSREHGMLVPRRLPNDYDKTIPQGYFFIYPTLPPAQYHNLPNAEKVEVTMRSQISLVPEERIRGRVYMIISPLNRIGRVRG